MKALFYHKRLKLKDIPIPQPGKDDALIKIRMAGICHTDLEILQGYMRFCGVIGHEFVGEVTFSEHERWIGQRVVGEINIGCEKCSACQQNLYRHCPNRQVLGISNKDGAFAEYITLPVKNLLQVPDVLSDQQAVFTEPLAAACEILEQVHIEPKHRVAIFGDGKLGQLIARVLRLTGCQLTLFGRYSKKLDLLKNLNVHTCLSDQENSELFDIVIDATGSSEGFYQAINYVKPRGIFILKSTTHKKINFNPARLVIDEIVLIGSRCGPFSPALRLLEMGIIDVEPLISHIYSFRTWEESFQASKRKDNLKILISMTE